MGLCHDEIRLRRWRRGGGHFAPHDEIRLREDGGIERSAVEEHTLKFVARTIVASAEGTPPRYNLHINELARGDGPDLTCNLLLAPVETLWKSTTPSVRDRPRPM